jgi:surface polysaccharide O-acyltransferase-like enzyme
MIWLDALRLVAGVSMVGLHATADPTGEPFPSFPPEDRIAPMLVRAVIYTARTELFIIIALFLMILALERRPRPYFQVVGEQARRLLLPFVFWTLFYAGYNLIKADAFGYLEASLVQLCDPVAWAKFMLLGDVKYHMHFLPTLFAIVLFFPLFRAAEKKPWLGLLVLVGLAVRREIDGALYNNLWGSPWLDVAVRITKVFSYVGYGLVAASFAGLWRQRVTMDLRAWTTSLLGAGVVLFAIKLVATWRTVTTGRWPHDFTPGYWADFLMPVVLFSICLSLSHLRWPPVLSRLAPYSFGIYLCHPIFLDLIEIGLRNARILPITQVLTKVAVALPCTALFVVTISRIPALAWIIGLGPLPFRRGLAVRSTANRAAPTSHDLRET